MQLRGLALMNDHRFADARRVAEEILKAEPNDPIALGFLAVQAVVAAVAAMSLRRRLEIVA